MASLIRPETALGGNAQKILRVLFCLLLIAMAPSRTWSHVGATEQQIKAVFLYKFCFYIEWRPDAFLAADSPITIGVVNAEEIATELESIARNRTIDGRPVLIKRLDEDAPLDEVQMLFLGGRDQKASEKGILRGRPFPLLIVTEAESDLPNGSSINLALEENRVRFDVDLDAVHRHGIKLSAQLLQVARTVHRGGEE